MVHRADAGHIHNLGKLGTVSKAIRGNGDCLNVAKINLFEVGTTVEGIFVDHRKVCVRNRLFFLGDKVHLFQSRTVVEGSRLNFYNRRRNDDFRNIIVVLKRLFPDIPNVHIGRNGNDAADAVIIGKGVIADGEFVLHTQNYRCGIESFRPFSRSVLLHNRCGKDCRALL